MGVDVDEARRDGEPVRVVHLGGRFVDRTDRDDATIAHPDVGDPAGNSGPVDDEAAPETEVEHGRIVSHCGVARIAVGDRHVEYDDPWAADPARLPVICVHGSSFGRGTWQGCMPFVAASGRYRPVVLDQPGHGGSSGPACRSVAELGVHLGQVLDALVLPRPIALVGHSLGGAVVQWVQRARPAEVCALGLVSTLPRFTVAPDTLAGWKEEGTAFSETRLDAIVSPEASAGTRLRVLAARADTTLDALHGDLDSIAAWTNPDWIGIEVPTLVVTADADTPSIRDAARAWVAGLPAGTLAVIDGAGHMMPIEQPEATARAIVEWLDATVAVDTTRGG